MNKFTDKPLPLWKRILRISRKESVVWWKRLFGLQSRELDNVPQVDIDFNLVESEDKVKLIAEKCATDAIDKLIKSRPSYRDITFVCDEEQTLPEQPHRITKVTKNGIVCENA